MILLVHPFVKANIEPNDNPASYALPDILPLFHSKTYGCGDSSRINSDRYLRDPEPEGAATRADVLLNARRITNVPKRIALDASSSLQQDLVPNHGAGLRVFLLNAIRQ